MTQSFPPLLTKAATHYAPKPIYVGQYNQLASSMEYVKSRDTLLRYVGGSPALETMTQDFLHPYRHLACSLALLFLNDYFVIHPEPSAILAVPETAQWSCGLSSSASP